MRSLLVLPCLVIIACNGIPEPPAVTAVDPTVIETRMQEYVTVTHSMDVEKMAAFYSATAELFEPGIPPIITRDSILAFMRFFAGAKVNSAEVEPRMIDVFDSTAYYWGSYHENLDFPGQPTSDQTGLFVAKWILHRDGSWLIERMYRIPLTSMPAAAVEAAP